MEGTTKAVAPVNTAMFDKAERDSGGAKSIMESIHNFKIYNPNIDTPVDPDKAMKFKMVEANTGDESYDDFGGSVVFNPLDVSYFYSGSIFPLIDGKYSDKKVFCSTNEFGKFAKKSDTIGLAINSKPVGFFTKGEFEEMIRTPTLNGGINQFYDRKKDKEGKPYDSSFLSRGAVIYGQFVGGQYDGEFFRMFTSLSNIGVTYKDGAVCQPDEGTFEYAVNQGLSELNDALRANGRKEVSRISPDQCDIKLSIRKNEKGIFLPVFEYAGLVALRGEDNSDSQKYIYDLKNEHFTNIFGTMLAPTPILIANGSASVEMAQIKLAAPTASSNQPELSAADGEAVFDEPAAAGVEEHKAHESGLAF